MTLFSASLAALAAFALSDGPGAPLTAAGEFDVAVILEVEGDDGGPDRYRLEKTYHGGMSGPAAGEMLGVSHPDAGAGAYVAIERFEGVLDGRAGGFALVHRGVMDESGQELSMTIAPGSGTGGLAGISGRMTLTPAQTPGRRGYELEYTLPQAEGAR
ncbi:MAG: DUF3224 domain-containing protein [Maricaulaceae bacterium]|nr:DUF3224 domain-containing protein [Maricaulaceae bacterium]